MRTVQLDLPDELVQELAPYREHLPELLALGLHEWKRRQLPVPAADQERIRQFLRTVENVTLPQPYQDETPYVRHTPVPSLGKPASEIVIEQRD